jgi:hypothetical protein
MGPAFHRVSGQVAGSDQTDATIHFMIQIGGGVNLVVRRGLGFVGAVDYRRASLDDVTEGGSGLNEMRLFAGVRLSR